MSRVSVSDTGDVTDVESLKKNAGQDVLDGLAKPAHTPDGKPTFEVGGSATIAHARAQRESKKGEDSPCIINGESGAPAAFAVFDGHSGQRSSKACANSVCQRILAKGPPFTAEKIADVMWAVDEEIGTQGAADGATAQILLIEPGQDGGLKGTFAWCGDSSAVVTDCSEGTVKFATASHTAGPDHQDGGAWKEEKVMLEHFREVRKAVEAKNGIDTQKNDVTADMVRAAIEGTGKTPTDADVALLTRAFRRCKIIAETTPEKAESVKNVFVRQRDKDHDVNQVWVVSTAETRSDPAYSDIQMTRSMVDWRAADLVLPNPQVHSFEVPAGAIFRVCLASDGLWDVVKFEEAAEEMRKAKTVRGARHARPRGGMHATHAS